MPKKASDIFTGKEFTMRKKPRYVVMLEGGKNLYRGNIRFVAWIVWLIHRPRKAIAYDCGIWIVQPAYWIRAA